MSRPGTIKTSEPIKFPRLVKLTNCETHSHTVLFYGHHHGVEKITFSGVPNPCFGPLVNTQTLADVSSPWKDWTEMK